MKKEAKSTLTLSLKGSFQRTSSCDKFLNIPRNLRRRLTCGPTHWAWIITIITTANKQTHKHMHKQMQTTWPDTYTHGHITTHSHLHTHVHKPTKPTHVHVARHTHACMHAHKYTYVQKHTHTQAHSNTKHCCQCFIPLQSLNPPSKSMRQTLLLILFLRWGNWTYKDIK